jgi:uncharacterized iron-regulated protein
MTASTVLTAALLAVSFAAPLSSAEIAAEALDALPDADVVILGEVHDNPVHHQNQARAVAAIRPAALVFEMLTPEQAARASGVSRDDAAGLEAALGWNNWPDFAMYHPIFTAAPTAQIRGGALPIDEVRRSIIDGAARVFGEGADEYGLTTALRDEDQAAREALQMSAHCDALPEVMLPGMVEAQRLRDAALARATVQAHAATGGPVVVITGTGHARRDHGIPAKLAIAAPGLSVMAVGQMEADPGAEAPFDLWVVTGGVDRPDPCAAFR